MTTRTRIVACRTDPFCYAYDGHPFEHVYPNAEAAERAARTDRTPHRGDPIVIYQERRTVLDLIDRGSGLLVVAEDDAGLRIERYADRLTWDDDARAWRAVA